jgi:hypothetical protein
MKIAALYVEADGVYFGLPDVDPWALPRGSREYPGPHPVVAHPPCQRWGKYHGGSPREPFQYHLGDDGGRFAQALWAVRTFGGVLEHPADSKAYRWYGLKTPPRAGGWVPADDWGGSACYVEQGHYGHFSRKGTWLYSAKVSLPELIWGPSIKPLPEWMIKRYGYEKARRIGHMAMVGGKRKTEIRDATPIEFRDLLLSIARGIIWTA